MKSIFLCFLLFPLLVSNVFAQFEQKVPLGVNIMFGRMSTNMHSRGFNNFVESYNQAYSGYLSTELAPIDYKTGSFQGIGITAAVFNFDLMWEQASGHSEAVFTNGTARVWDVDERTTTFNFGLLVPIGHFGKIGPCMGIIKRNGTFASGFRYPDGYVSYGIEKRLNGIYHMNLNSSLTFGFQANAGFKYGFIYARFEWVGFMYNQSVESQLPIRDKLGGQSGYYRNYTLNYYHVDDIANSQNPNMYFVGQEGTVQAALKGHRFHIGIALFLGHHFEYED